MSACAVVDDDDDDDDLQYKMALDDLKKVVADLEGPDLKDQLRDDRFRWWLKEKEEKGKMHDDVCSS